MRRRTASLVLLAFAAACAPSRPRPPRPEPRAVYGVYGPVPPARYLLGQFDPADHPDFVTVASVGVPSAGTQLLRLEAAGALARLFAALRRDLPEAHFEVISAARSFDTQRRIWTRKWYRYRGDALVRGRRILRFSAMPGTSRHHWGTDVDLIKLSNRYFWSGNGGRIYRWLVQNAARFGFCQPYTAGRARGYLEERWHWSYRPLAARFLADWQARFSADASGFVQASPFVGNAAVAPLAATYVDAIDGSCREGGKRGGAGVGSAPPVKRGGESPRK